MHVHFPRSSFKSPDKRKSPPFSLFLPVRNIADSAPKYLAGDPFAKWAAGTLHSTKTGDTRSLARSLSHLPGIPWETAADAADEAGTQPAMKKHI